jgi:prepilin peptidase CpaA
MTFPAPHLASLGFLLAVAAGWDISKRRIPNLITGAVALSGVVAQVADHGGWAAASGLTAGAISIFALYKPWAAGGVGGGDVKLAAAAAIWVGLRGMIGYVLAVAVAGGAVALGTYLCSRKAIRQEVRANLALLAMHQALPTVEARAPGRVSVPYAIAIVAGAAFALIGPWRP